MAKASSCPKGSQSRSWVITNLLWHIMGHGTYVGYFISQNGHGHVLGHVKGPGDIKFGIIGHVLGR